MVKRNTIGFKSCLEDTKENNSSHQEEENDENRIKIPQEAIEEIENQINSKREFEDHMEEYNKLLKNISLIKNGVIIALAILILFLVYKLGYKNGAYEQEYSGSIYTKITDTQTGKTFIVRK